MKQEGKPKLSPVVIRLGWVSFFTDAASEMLYPLIPIFLTVTLGAPVFALGLVEGLADGVATGLRAVAGLIADRFRRLREMVFFGYGLSAVAKPLIAIAPNWGVVGGLRVSDRVGKAVRGVPRDVIISDVTEPEHRGRAFGFHRAMDSAGAMVGPLVGIGVLLLIGQQNLRPVFLVALIPGLASVWLLTGLPRTDKPAGEEKWEPAPLPWRGKFGWFVAATALFSIGNSSDAFLLLRAKNLGLSTIQVILAYAAFNLVYAVVSLPAGIKSDKSGRFRVYSFGLIAFAVVYAGFGLARSAMLVWPLIAFYGIYMALTDGIGRALVVDLVPQSARGKALGVTQAITGGGVLIAGVLAGILWDQVSPSTPFLVGAVTAVLGAVMLVTTVGAGRTS